jgi:hypothetical protein
VREVRVSNPFFDDVDQLFPPERGPDGQPSADDIVRYVVPSLIAEIGERYDDVSDMPDNPGVKAFVLPGILLPVVVVYAGEMPDGVIYLLGLETDTDPIE